jgi:tetratricopeptide (TPR) repeat protein
MGYGPTWADWGYAPYVNPYFISSPVVVQEPLLMETPTLAFDYSRPLEPQVEPPAETDQEAATRLFDQARGQFRSGDYAEALSLTDQAIQKLPSDATLHEFRALSLFSLGRFDDASATLYPVLSVGPGWDWSTLIGLYPGVSTYTTQLRALERARNENPARPSIRFLLAYHYVTAGHDKDAIRELERLQTLQPDDKLATSMLSRLKGDGPPEPAAPPPADGAEPPLEAPRAIATPDPTVKSLKLSDLAGVWKAQPAPEVTIELTFKDESEFAWKVTEKGAARTILGASSLGNGLLTLVPNQGGQPMVGTLSEFSPTGFRFKLAGGGPDDKGLEFKK